MTPGLTRSRRTSHGEGTCNPVKSKHTAEAGRIAWNRQTAEAAPRHFATDAKICIFVCFQQSVKLRLDLLSRVVQGLHRLQAEGRFKHYGPIVETVRMYEGRPGR